MEIFTYQAFRRDRMRIEKLVVNVNRVVTFSVLSSGGTQGSTMMVTLTNAWTRRRKKSQQQRWRPFTKRNHHMRVYVWRYVCMYGGMYVWRYMTYMIQF
jgi:hypothetical protein